MKKKLSIKLTANFVRALITKLILFFSCLLKCCIQIIPFFQSLFVINIYTIMKWITLFMNLIFFFHCFVCSVGNCRTIVQDAPQRCCQSVVDLWSVCAASCCILVQTLGHSGSHYILRDFSHVFLLDVSNSFHLCNL